MKTETKEHKITVRGLISTLNEACKAFETRSIPHCAKMDLLDALEALRSIVDDERDDDDGIW